MDFALTDEQEMIKEAARAFTDKEIVPRARENDRNHHFDTELVQKIADQGYLGAIVPREYGGAGLDYLTYAIICEEVGRGCSAMRTVVSVQTSLVCSTLVKWGTEEQKQQYLPKLCSGEWLGCFGLTEPDTGSDAANQKTRARKTDDGWSISGGKMWISLGNHAKLALVFAQTDPSLDAPRARLLPRRDRRRPASAIRRSTARWACTAPTRRRSRSTTSRCPRARCSGRSATASRSPCRRSTPAATPSPPGCVGVCQGSLEASVAYSKERQQFGKPIGAFQLVQAMIAEQRVLTDAARLLVFRAGWVKDQGRPSTTETSIAKLYATEAAQTCSHLAIQVHGGSGYVDDHPVERYYRDVRVTTLYEGTSQIQKLIIGRAETGLNALV